MTLNSRTPTQRAEDRNILKKLTKEQPLTEVEENRLDVLLKIAAYKLGIEWPPKEK